MSKKLDSKEEYKKYKAELHQAMIEKQQVPYNIKIRMAESRIKEFYNEALSRGLNCHVSVGGLDSIVLAHLIRKMGYSEEQIPFVSASTLEDKYIRNRRQ